MLSMLTLSKLPYAALFCRCDECGEMTAGTYAKGAHSDWLDSTLAMPLPNAAQQWKLRAAREAAQVARAEAEESDLHGVQRGRQPRCEGLSTDRKLRWCERADDGRHSRGWREIGALHARTRTLRNGGRNGIAGD